MNIQRLYEVFAGIDRPGDDFLVKASWTAEGRRLLNNDAQETLTFYSSNWMEVIPKLVKPHDVSRNFFYLTAEGLAYFTPAHIVASLNVDANKSDLWIATIETFMPYQDAEIAEKFSSLGQSKRIDLPFKQYQEYFSEEQRSLIAEFLEVMRNRYVQDLAQEKIWDRFVRYWKS